NRRSPTRSRTVPSPRSGTSPRAVRTATSASPQLSGISTEAGSSPRPISTTEAGPAEGAITSTASVPAGAVPSPRASSRIGRAAPPGGATPGRHRQEGGARPGPVRKNPRHPRPAEQVLHGPRGVPAPGPPGRGGPFRAADPVDSRLGPDGGDAIHAGLEDVDGLSAPEPGVGLLRRVLEQTGRDRLAGRGPADEHHAALMARDEGATGGRRACGE